MAKAGLIDEMMNDALDSALDNEDIEEETDAEVEKVGCRNWPVCRQQHTPHQHRVA